MEHEWEAEYYKVLHYWSLFLHKNPHQISLKFQQRRNVEFELEMT
jgi:hypothetical protein